MTVVETILASDDTFDITYNWDCFSGGLDNTVYTIAIQEDGKILCGGDFTRYDREGNCNYFNYIIRLNSDASVDDSFLVGAGFDSSVYTIALQSDGKNLCGGYFNYYNNNEFLCITRLNQNGTIDNTFANGGFNFYLNKIKSCKIQT